MYRRVQRFTPLFADAARFPRHPPSDRWFVDETYVKVKGVWRYVYRPLDHNGQVLDVRVSKPGCRAQRNGWSGRCSSTRGSCCRGGVSFPFVQLPLAVIARHRGCSPVFRSGLLMLSQTLEQIRAHGGQLGVIGE